MHLKRILPAFILLLLFSGAVHSQNADTSGFQGFKEVQLPQQQNLFKVGTTSFLVGQILFCGELRLMYERMLTHNQSLLATVSYNYPSPFLLLGGIFQGKNSIVGQYSIRGGRIALGYRFYPLKKFVGPEGLFFGPYLSYNFAKIKERHGAGDYWTINNWNANMVVGYQLQVADHWYLEAFTGLGYKNAYWFTYDAAHNRSSSEPYYLIKPFRNVNLCGQFNIAYAF